MSAPAGHAFNRVQTLNESTARFVFGQFADLSYLTS